MTYTYKQSIAMIGRGLWSILKKLPKTFAKNTARIVINHPIYLIIFLTIIIWQASMISRERLQRDADSKRIYIMQQQLDSLQGKNITFRAYR